MRNAEHKARPATNYLPEKHTFHAEDAQEVDNI